MSIEEKMECLKKEFHNDKRLEIIIKHSNDEDFIDCVYKATAFD